MMGAPRISVCRSSGIPNLPFPQSRGDRTPRTHKHLLGQVRGTSHGSFGSSRGAPPSPPTRASVSPGAEQDEQAQPHPGSFGTDPCVPVNTGKGPPESPRFLLPLHHEAPRPPPLLPGWPQLLDRPDGLVRRLRRSRAQGERPGSTSPRSHLGSAEPSAEGSGQHGASRSSAAARLPAPAARRRGGSAPGTARGADRSGSAQSRHRDDPSAPRRTGSL